MHDGVELSGDRACIDCLRRSWLLAQLIVPLDFCSRDRDRLGEALALDDESLIAALGGRRRPELRAQLARFRPDWLRSREVVMSVCRHDPLFPASLRSREAPRALFSTPGARRLRRLSAAPVVALLGPARASDYGIEMAHALGRGLGAAGVTVACGLHGGVAVAAQTGAAEVGGGAIAVLGGGLDTRPAARHRGLLNRVLRSGCAISELPCGCHGRRFGDIAAERILAELATVAVVVEARARPDELAAARSARALGRTLAAVPGRATSALSEGANALLREGAILVRDPGDVIELLAALDSPAPALAAGTATPTATPSTTDSSALEPRLLALLERVGAGADTAEKLCAGGGEPGEVLLALSELEVLGALVRGDGGRYLPHVTERK